MRATNQQQTDMLWNQKGADSGTILFGRMAASYNMVLKKGRRVGALSRD